MAFIEYHKLNVWINGNEFAKMIYLETGNFPQDEIYGLTQQIRRAAVSIISNIAVSCGRNHTKDKLQFFYISRGSLFDVEAQIIIARELQYISETAYLQLLNHINVCKKLQNGFITYHKNLLAKKS